jgi:hypothetical protein
LRDDGGLGIQWWWEVGATYRDFLHWTPEAAFGEEGKEVFVAERNHDDDDYGVEVAHYVVGDVMAEIPEKDEIR